MVTNEHVRHTKPKNYRDNEEPCYFVEVWHSDSYRKQDSNYITDNMNVLSGNLVTKISDHFPQFLIIEDLKVNYASFNYYKHD